MKNKNKTLPTVRGIDLKCVPPYSDKCVHLSSHHPNPVREQNHHPAENRTITPQRLLRIELIGQISRNVTAGS